MDCNTCKEKRTEVPYLVHESTMARMERTNKRLWIVVIILIVSLIATNAGWIWYESQFELVTETTTQEVWQETDGGDNQFFGGDYNGDPTR